MFVATEPLIGPVLTLMVRARPLLGSGSLGRVDKRPVRIVGVVCVGCRDNRIGTFSDLIGMAFASMTCGEVWFEISLMLVPRDIPEVEDEMRFDEDDDIRPGIEIFAVAFGNPGTVM